MIDQQKLKEARAETVTLSDQQTDKNRTMMWMARESGDTKWLWSEYQTFFMSGIYGNATGATVGNKKEIIDLVVTKDGADWIEQHCVNPFWFWSTLGAACQCASTLPLTVTDLENGARRLFENRSAEVGRATGVSGWPSGYSGPQTPWHVFDLYNRGHIWNNQHCIDIGMTNGLLLMQRFSPRHLPLLKPFQPRAAYSARIIYNPLFASLSTTEPVGNDFEE